MRAFLFPVAVLMSFVGAAWADPDQKAIAAGGGNAINAKQSIVYVDQSNKTFNVSNKDDARRNAELEYERKQLLAEIARLSSDNEGEIIKRSRQELVDSLPAEIRAKYDAGDRQGVVEFLEKKQSPLKTKAEKISLALSKSKFEIAVIISEINYSSAVDYLRSALVYDPNNLAATALLVQLLSKLGQINEAIRLIDGLMLSDGISRIATAQSDEMIALVGGFYLSAVTALIDEGRFEKAAEVARRGISRAKTETNRGNANFRDLEKILVLMLDMSTIFGAVSDDRGNYARIQEYLDKVDYSFKDCAECWGYKGVIASLNMVLVRWAQTRGASDVVSLGFKRANDLMAAPGLPNSVWQLLQYELLLSVSRGARLNGVTEIYLEYRKKAADHLRIGIDKGLISYERQLNLVDHALDTVDDLLDDSDKNKLSQGLADAAFILARATEQTKGYEDRHISQLLRLGDLYSLADSRTEAERIYFNVEQQISVLEKIIDASRYLRLLNSLYASKGYHYLRNAEYVEASRIVDLWLKNGRQLKAINSAFDVSIAEELKARVSLYVGGCEAFQQAIGQALETFENSTLKSQDQIAYLNRFRRLLKLSTLCLLPGKTASERYSKIFAYTDVLFVGRPWDSELVDDLIYSINGMMTQSIIADGGGMIEYYMDIARSRMLSCSRYKVVSARCSAFGAYALGMLGMSKIGYDPLLLETSLKEFRAIKKSGQMIKVAREWYITTLTIYAGGLNFLEKREKYIELQKEALQIYEDIPKEDRSESMNLWSTELQLWFASGSKEKFSQLSWLYFGQVEFR